MLMDMYLPKFDIYQGTVAPNFLRATPTLDALTVDFQKKLLPDVWFEIFFVRRNVFTRHSDRT